MRREDVQDILTRIPEVDLSKVQILLRNGYVISIDICIRFEANYCVIRGREGGTTDEGRGFFIPYDEITTFKLERVMKLSEMNRMYGVDSGVDSEDKLAVGAVKTEEKAKPEAATTAPASQTPVPAVSDPSQVAKNNLLARIRAARTAAGAKR
ncbi:MAG TPA: hypothetical protein VGJ05_17615 [Fimbriiglobus sp.]|jgi:hypothetical protein